MEVLLAVLLAQLGKLGGPSPGHLLKHSLIKLGSRTILEQKGGLKYKNFNKKDKKHDYNFKKLIKIKKF